MVAIADDQNKAVRNTSKPISHMASLKLETFERTCMKFYAEKVVQLFDPDFFEEEANIQEFERLTHGKIPSLDKLNRSKQSAA